MPIPGAYDATFQLVAERRHATWFLRASSPHQPFVHSGRFIMPTHDPGQSVDGIELRDPRRPMLQFGHPHHACRRFATCGGCTPPFPGTHVPGYCISSLRNWDGSTPRTSRPRGRMNSFGQRCRLFQTDHRSGPLRLRDVARDTQSCTQSPAQATPTRSALESPVDTFFHRRSQRASPSSKTCSQRSWTCRPS